jgi:hypothetical protein
LATDRLAATGAFMPDVFFASFSPMLNFVSGLFLAARRPGFPVRRHGFAVITAL